MTTPTPDSRPGSSTPAGSPGSWPPPSWPAPPPRAQLPGGTPAAGTPAGHTDLDQPWPPSQPPPPARRRRLGAGAALAVSGLVLGGIGAAGIAGATSDPADSATPAPSLTSPDGARPDHGGHRGFGMHGFGGRPLHGEFVVETDDGFATMLTQRGTVTAVSSSEITVESADGFDGTYAISSDTSFGRGSGSLSDIQTGDEVTVVARDGDGTPAALFVAEGGGGRLHDRDAVPAPTPDASASSDTT
jgi:hypothetical protein